MAPAPSKLHADDVSLLMVLLDTNPYFWSSSNLTTTTLSFTDFLSHALSFLNSILLLSQLNQVVVIASGYNSCGYVYDSSSSLIQSSKPSGDGGIPVFYSELLGNLEEFISKDEKLCKEESIDAVGASLLSGSLSLALCYIQRVFRSGPLHPQPRLEPLIEVPHFLSHLGSERHTEKQQCESSCVGFCIDHACDCIIHSLVNASWVEILCLHGSPDGPEQYVAIMNAIFSAQRSMVPIDSCVIGGQHSAFLQQASYITEGVYLKPPQLNGLFQYLCTVFATDLHSRTFLQLPKPVGVDFRASCFCHKNTIDMGYICSVCLSIFCKNHKKCSTCGSVFGQAKSEAASTSDKKRRKPES